MKNIITAVLLLFALSACDVFNSVGGNTETSTTLPVDVQWENLTRVADTYTLEPVPEGITTQDWVEKGQMAATQDSICIVLWNTALHAIAGCRSISIDIGVVWPYQCAGDPNNPPLVVCSAVYPPDSFFLVMFGGPRELSADEAELADEIRRKTYCTAPRVDNSPSPCAIT